MTEKDKDLDRTYYQHLHGRGDSKEYYSNHWSPYIYLPTWKRMCLVIVFQYTHTCSEVSGGVVGMGSVH